MIWRFFFGQSKFIFPQTQYGNYGILLPSTIFSQKFREINFLLKKFTLDGFDEKKLWFFHTVPQCGREIPSRTLFAKISWKQCFTKEITKELILTKLFLVRENFSQSVSRKNIPSSFFDARIDFTENSVKEVCRALILRNIFQFFDGFFPHCTEIIF